MSEQGKSTVQLSDSSGCVHSATPHRACGALSSVFLLAILDGWKLLEKLKGAATTISSYLGNTPSGTQLQVEIFPLDILWEASLRNRVFYRQYSMHKKKIQSLENATQGIGCGAPHPAGTLQASLLSFCNLFKMELEFATELKDLLYLQRHHRLAEKDFERAKSEYSLCIYHMAILHVNLILFRQKLEWLVITDVLWKF